MDRAAEILLNPFKGIVESLQAQVNDWTLIQEVLNQCLNLPCNLSKTMSRLNTLQSETDFPELVNLINDSIPLSVKAYEFVTSEQQVISYLGLVGVWAVIESSFDDLVKRILVNDSEATNKLIEAGVKTKSKHPSGSERWINETAKSLEYHAKQKSKGYVIEIHKAMLDPFGIKLHYPDDKRQIIEELNQVRNCILHQQGRIDERAVLICPRFNIYLNSTIPTTDPLFKVTNHMLLDYLVAWIAALMHSPYLKNGLLPEAKNPFCK